MNYNTPDTTKPDSMVTPAGNPVDGPANPQDKNATGNPNNQQKPEQKYANISGDDKNDSSWKANKSDATKA